MKRNRKHDQRGFTLIELLVVIAVLAVLFGVTAVSLTGVGSTASQEAAKAEADMVQTAIDVCAAVSGCPTPAAAACNQPGGGITGFETYLRRQTRFYVGWDSTGKVTGVYDDDDEDCGGPALWP